MPKVKHAPTEDILSDESREILKVICMPGWKYIKDYIAAPKMALESDREYLLKGKSGIKSTDLDALNFILARLRERDLVLSELECLEDDVKPEEISPAKA